MKFYTDIIKSYVVNNVYIYIVGGALTNQENMCYIIFTWQTHINLDFEITCEVIKNSLTLK